MSVIDAMKSVGKALSAIIKRRRETLCQTLTRNAIMCVHGSRKYLVLKCVIEEVAQSIETLDPRTLLSNIKRFIELLTSENCMVIMSSLFQRREDEFLKRIELELQHKLIELESDRANTRLQREIILLKTLRDKVLKGYTPLFSRSYIVLLCDVTSLDDDVIRDYVASLSERIELASSIISIKLRSSTPTTLDFLTINNFR